MKSVKPRIKKVFKEQLENVGKPLGQIMRENGYADNTADNPDHLTTTKSWEMLCEEYLPDSLLTQVAKEGLGATQVKTSFTEPDKTIPDYAIRQRYLETALKMKGRLVDKSEIKIKELPKPLLTGVSSNHSPQETPRIEEKN